MFSESATPALSPRADVAKESPGHITVDGQALLLRMTAPQYELHGLTIPSWLKKCEDVVPERVRVERKAGLSQFSDETVQHAATKQMINRINSYVDPDAESAGLDKMTSLYDLPRSRDEISGMRRICPNGPKQKPRRSLPS
jgi:hypothetical protein